MRLRLAGLALLTVALFGMGQPEEPRWTGVVSLKGHEPFVILALVDDQGRQWALRGPLVDELRATVQGRRVTVTGQMEGSSAILVRSWAWADDEE